MKYRPGSKRAQATRRKSPKNRHSLGDLRNAFAWKRVSMWLFVILPALAVFGGYQWLKNPQHMTIKTVEVAGDLKILNKEMLEPIIADFVKTNLFLLDSDALEAAVEDNEWVYSASLTKIWPDKLIVKIHEQQPVAFWGDKAMLSKQGAIIKTTLKDKQGVLPTLYSPESKGRNMASGFLQIREWMKDFPVRLVEFREDARGSWQIKLENDLLVKIGRNNHEKRIMRFMVGYRQKLISVVNRIDTVDLRYPNGFAVKWKKLGKTAEKKAGNQQGRKDSLRS